MKPHEFVSVVDVDVQDLMPGIHARAVHGERITLAVVELDAGVRMPEHRHVHEQVGCVLRGEFTFTVGGETRVRRPGDMWVIPPTVPHSVEHTGPAGCTVIETFSPPREDWAGIPHLPPSPGAWPPR